MTYRPVPENHRVTFTGTCNVNGSDSTVTAMKFAWQFNKVNPRFKNREATQGEFFSNDTELRGFVREAVQNSLDAKRSRVRTAVRVRIFLSGDEAALSPEKAERYVGSGWNHFHSEGCGLRDAPGVQEPCRFLVYEDSGTTGLTGDVSQYHEVPGERNPFYYFFRAEGQSNKTDGGRGRWGLGKFVFPRSSRIRSFFGVTVRHDDRKRLLVGQSILRSHQVKGKSFTPDGWFGASATRSQASLPVSDQRFINKFLRDFQMKRGDDPGLSIVVPYCDARWTMEAMHDAVLMDYFYPILRGDLVVNLETPGAKLILNSQTIVAAVETCSPELQKTLAPLVNLAQWSLQETTQSQIVNLPASAVQGASVSRQAIPTDTLDLVRKQFRENGRVIVRVPVAISSADGEVKDSCFDVQIEQNEGALQKRPLFIRDGLVISDVRTRLIRDVNVLVTVNDSPLSIFLGDAENPAHTEWSEESSHLKGKYRNGGSTIRCVRNLPSDLCQLLSEAEQDDDPILLLNVFSLSASTPGQGVPVEFASMTSQASLTGLQRLKLWNPSKRKSKPFRTTSRKGGFRVGSPAKATGLCSPIEVAVAYDRRNGSPLKNHQISDFRLDRDPIRLAIHNATVQHLDSNRMLIVPKQFDFEVVVSGFDLNRDLFLKAQLAPDLRCHDSGNPEDNRQSLKSHERDSLNGGSLLSHDQDRQSARAA